MAAKGKTRDRMPASASEGRWVFGSHDEVRRFWVQVREVPRRTNGRTAKQYERFYLGLYLVALADRELLSYPLEVVEGESPDFMLTWKSGDETGLEVTRATDQELQRWMTRAEKEHPNASAILPSSLGYAGDQLEREWCGFVRAAVEKKVAKLEGYRPAARHDLLIADDTRAGAGNCRKVLALLAPWARDLEGREARLGKISVAASLDILYDIGGESQMLPYVHWCAPGSENGISNESLSQRAELAGRLTVERAIREPSQRNPPSDAPAVPGYYVDAKGRIIKHTSDGQRFEVRIKQDGSEIVIKELPPA